MGVPPKLAAAGAPPGRFARRSVRSASHPCWFAS
jgi:hypothetical protein